MSYGGLQGKKINHGYCKTFLYNSIISLLLIPQLGILFYMVLPGKMADFLIFSSWIIYKDYSNVMTINVSFFDGVRSDAV